MVTSALVQQAVTSRALASLAARHRLLGSVATRANAKLWLRCPAPWECSVSTSRSRLPATGETTRGAAAHSHRPLAPVAAAAASPSASSTISSTSTDESSPASIDYFASDTRPIVLYDGVCNLCNGGVNFALDNDAQGRLRFAALQSAAGRSLLEQSGRSPDDISSIVLVDGEGAHIKSDAVLRIGQLLNLPFPPLAFLAALAPKPILDIVYDGVADNRYNILGIRDECRLSDGRYADRFIS